MAMKSFYSQSASRSTMLVSDSGGGRSTITLLNGRNVLATCMHQKRTVYFSAKSLALLHMLRQTINLDQLNAFVGIAFNFNSALTVIWAGGCRCLLRDILFSDDFNMTKDFADSFVRDMLKVRG